MSLKTVVEEIRNEARETAETIREEAEAEAESIVAEAEADAEQIIENREEAVEREIEQLRDRRLSSAQLEAKQQRLAAKRDLLDEVRSAVEAHLSSLDADRREAMTRALLEAGIEEFADDDGSTGTVQVSCAPQDEALVAELLETLDDVDATLAGTRDCLGGVYIESTASRVRVDNTFDSVLDDVWSETLKAVSDRLFPEE